MHNFAQLKRDFSFSALVAGFFAVLISYAGPLVIVFQAAKIAHLPTDIVSSWVWAISIGSGILGIVLSYKYKTPIITAWSTPGAALLVTAFTTVNIHEAVAVYMLVAAATLIIGLSGIFDKFINLIPKGICSALLVGILFNFGMNTFKAMQSNFLLVALMLLIYLFSKKIMSRYALAMTLIVGFVYSALSGLTHFSNLHFSLAQPIFIAPTFNVHSLVSLGIPLLLVSLTGQFMPGMAVLRSSGYSVKSSPIITLSAITSGLISIFGGHGVNLAAITAAICTGSECHHNTDKRYIAGIFSGLFYIVFGLFSSVITLLFISLPYEFMTTLAGLALIGAMLNGLQGLVTDISNKEASLITFITTASGLSLLGLGSAFWGVVFGLVAYFILKPKFQYAQEK
ncbi:benzoate/H(+) symporter BenE family transporter [Acinetobacter boissieri]|uniref:Benzoate membrane transport protein n=1 Tax=Acinetobacter boissieri TaxID=1219383 RepID=A0A1G6GR34_9GAMM|nr:benzoate/H(+) symporter BenE family transporter [Acinetobacter boissieri]SDB84303.1 benzoate membrane transport protein [Acinetobacter boissieri]